MTANQKTLACFKAYDVRGHVPRDLSLGLTYDIGRAYAAEIAPDGPVAVGYDARPSSEQLTRAFIRGLNDAGCDTLDIGLCGTEMIYFASALPNIGGGVMVTASHNPITDNGMKMVRAGGVPIGNDSGLKEIEARTLARDFGPVRRRGSSFSGDVTAAYVEHLMTFVDLKKLNSLKVVVNAGNGAAGPAFDALAPYLPFKYTRVHHEPDSRFPNGIPNPLLEANRPATAEAVRAAGADMGVAWDGDFDRCFLFDERGEFIEGYYIVGLLAERVLRAHPGATIVHDPRLMWNTLDIVTSLGGRAVQSPTGHAFIKALMRKEDALYGGEMSAHHYFKDFFFCDSGMVPWLLVATLMCESGKPLSALVGERVARFPCSGEINLRVDDAPAAIKRVRDAFVDKASAIDETDGLSLSFDDTWRFNLRSSQTEPILRLNVEAAGDKDLMDRQTQAVLTTIDPSRG